MLAIMVCVLLVYPRNPQVRIARLSVLALEMRRVVSFRHFCSFSLAITGLVIIALGSSSWPLDRVNMYSWVFFLGDHRAGLIEGCFPKLSLYLLYLKVAKSFLLKIACSWTASIFSGLFRCQRVSCRISFALG